MQCIREWWGRRELEGLETHREKKVIDGNNDRGWSKRDSELDLYTVSLYMYRSVLESE